MKLQQHVLKIRKMIHTAFQNRFEKLGLYEHSQKSLSEITSFLQEKRSELDVILGNHLIEQNGDYVKARFEAIDECTFTLFNRIAAIKVMESRELFPEIIRQRTEYANRSFAHNAWLEEHPEERNEEREGLKAFLRDEFDKLASDVYIFSSEYPYSLFPTADELFHVIQAFNEVEEDPDCGSDTWANEDILGWLYESYNAIEKEQLKASGEKTEFDKVSLQSQVYTPKWVVKFLVDNSLGKQYLEMYPQSELRFKYKIANAPVTPMRRPMKMEEIKLIDPACGSGNFLLYAFDLFYDMYTDQLENYDAGYSRRDIPRLIIENNLHGADLDERAVQIAQIGLYIKARTHRSRRINHFNVVASHFVLPEYKEVSHAFEAGNHFDEQQKKIMASIWEDLRNAYKFGSLIRVEEKLDAMMPRNTLDLFSQSDMQKAFDFRNSFITNLRNQVENLTGENNNRFTRFKTNNAITFLDVISQKYDVAVANPPYTASADFGPDLKEFIEANYRKPLKFNTNLYASFIKRCCELTREDGKVGMIHPLTFMYIITFEDVRKFILENTHINIFVEYGLSNLFGSVMVDPAFYILEKVKKTPNDSMFISLDQYTRTPEEKNKKEYCLQALSDYIDNIKNKHIYTLPQFKLKGIKSYPFIYWISDEFREKFGVVDFNEMMAIRQGIATGANDRFLRFWWELNVSEFSNDYSKDNKKWVDYSKGGPYKKWFGNYWLKISFDMSSRLILETTGNHLPSKEFYFREGITYSGSGSKGTSFRYLPSNFLFDVGGSCIFPTKKYKNNLYSLALLNSKLCFYIANCLNPTVNTQVGDIKRVPFIVPNKGIEEKVTSLVKQNIEIKKHICSYSIIEQNYQSSPITSQSDVRSEIQNYFNYENLLLTQILLNEAIINEAVFEVYALSNHDKQMVLEKEGIPVGSLPVTTEAKVAYQEWMSESKEFPATKELIDYINTLPTEDIDKRDIVSGFETLYQSNNDLEAFCIKNKVNPINVWFWFREVNALPIQRAQTLVFELITDVIRDILDKDDDGVIPIIERSGEEQLAIHVEHAIIERGFSTSQFAQMMELLGCDINSYLQNKFFAQLSDHLNLFMYLPKTPFIWHISSGPYHALECYVSIYKWNRDTLSRLKSVYAANRDAALRDRLINLSGQESGTAKMEKELINNQLRELDSFRNKVDELLAEGYNPILDDGVGKNIAPLQKKGLLAYEVLNKKQLEKYLNADW